MNYTEDYLRTHDIDVFFVLNGIPVHVATAGGLIPRQMRNREKLRAVQSMVSSIDFVCNEEEVEYNERFLQQRFRQDEKARRDYLVSFTEMARKGFVSMDRTNWQESDDNHYHVVCKPKMNIAREWNDSEMFTFETENKQLLPSVEGMDINIFDYLEGE